jgi:hypothetical protein
VRLAGARRPLPRSTGLWHNVSVDLVVDASLSATITSRHVIFLVRVL